MEPVLSDHLDHSADGVEFHMLIDGEFVDASGGVRFSSENPYTRRPWASLPEATVTDVDAAVRAAQRAGHTGPWANLPPHERGRLVERLADVMEQHAEELARIETLDSGKLLSETSRQVKFSARTYRYFAGYADKLDGRVVAVEAPDTFDYVVHEPVGVCALLTPWNSPMQILGNKLPAALAAGNTAVVRPSELSAASTAYFGSLTIEAGLPPGVINVVTSASVDPARALTRHPDVSLVSLTGGVATGRSVAGAAGTDLKRAVTELGGKSPHIIFEDADLDAAIDGVIAGIFAAGGQSCIAGSRLLVACDVFDEVLKRLVDRAEEMQLGDPLKDATGMGPLANSVHFQRVRDYIEGGLEAGATMVTGGVDDAQPDSYFVRPTIFTDVNPAMAIVREEIFGPVLVVMPFSDEDELLDQANSTDFGLAAGLWTRDISRAMRIVKRINAGSVWVNTYRKVAPAAPFGGTGNSGIGRERGLEGLLEFTNVKNVMMDISV